MTEAMPFLQKAILLSYDPRPFGRDFFMAAFQEVVHTNKNGSLQNERPKK